MSCDSNFTEAGRKKDSLIYRADAEQASHDPLQKEQLAEAPPVCLKESRLQFSNGIEEIENDCSLHASSPVESHEKDLGHTNSVSQIERTRSVNISVIRKDQFPKESQTLNSEVVEKGSLSNKKEHGSRRARSVFEVQGLLSNSFCESTLFPSDLVEDDTSSSDLNTYSPDVETEEINSQPLDVNTNGRVDQDEIDSHLRRVQYKLFLDTMRNSACGDLVVSIRMFLKSIRRESDRLKGSKEYVDYQRVVDFFNEMENAFMEHPVWRHASEDELDAAREGIERYTMVRIDKIVFAVDEEEKKLDEALRLRLQYLSVFVTAEQLGVPKPCQNELVQELAKEELRRMNQYAAPVDKMHCIVRACSIIFNVLGLSKDASGADDFFPAFLFVVLNANVRNLWCNIEYIRKFRNPSDFLSKAGYCFVNLKSAVSFFQNVEPGALSMTKDDFENEMDLAIAQVSSQN